MEQTNIKKDSKGNVISKLNKEEFHVSFKEDFAEIIDVESYKIYNILTDKDEYINNIDDERGVKKRVDNDSDDEDKFNINEYEQQEIEHTPNTDRMGFSRAKCIIL